MVRCRVLLAVWAQFSWGMLLSSLIAGILTGSVPIREGVKGGVMVGATPGGGVADREKSRVEFLRGVGCEGVEVRVGGLSGEAHVEGVDVYLGENFFGGTWTDEEVCGIYWHERGHVELGHTQELGYVGAKRRVEQELEADDYGQHELARRGGGLCGLWSALKKVYNEERIADSDSYPESEMRLRRLREWGACS